MSEGREFAFETAMPVARIIAARIAPFCEQVVIAGSLRRIQSAIDGIAIGKIPSDKVHDIEIVAIPKIESQVDLFGDPAADDNLLDTYIAGAIELGTFGLRPDKNGRTACGERYKRLVYRPYSIPLDLFSVIYPAQLGVILAIRTGPAAFSRRLVTQFSKHPDGLLPDDMRVKDGMLWRAIRDKHHDDPEMRGWEGVPTKTERDVFAKIGADWLEPWERK